uniref:Tyrosine-protein phosphatase domain-containing protein n=1 Tax=Caenorhabditis japonica TaxID=281687 RepID=A0A8R1HMG3_CAEJA
MAPPTKSKETKKDAKTNRRKTAAKGNQTAASEGQTPADFLEQMAKMAKNRSQIYELMKPQAAYSGDVFVKKVKEKENTKESVTFPVPFNIRLAVPFSERRRVKVGNDEEYFSAQYCKLEATEYMIAQAPTKENHRVFWKAIQQDQTKILVCLTSEDQMTSSDDPTKCFKYFPTEEGQTMEIEQAKGKITVACKSKTAGSFEQVKYCLEYSDSEEKIDAAFESENPSASVSKVHPLTIFHMTTWTGTRPESGHPLDPAVNIAAFFQEVNKAEVDVLRKTMENFVAPVIIQSMDGIGRGAIAWVILMLLKDVEKRECFDLPDLIKKLQKMRPGCLSNYYQFAFCFAVALHIGKSMGWCEKDCTNALTDLTAKFPDRKLNEVGNLA